MDDQQHARARAVLERAFTLARELPDPALRAMAGCHWAAIQARDGATAEARRLVDNELRRLPEQPQFVLARIECLRRSYEVARESRDGATGVRNIEAARLALRSLPMVLPLRELEITMQLAAAYRIANRQRDAIARFEQAFDQMRRLGRDDTEQAGTLFNKWGNALANAGRPAEAVPLFERAIALGRSVDRDLSVSSAVLHNLGRAQVQLGRHDAALASAEQARAGALRAGDELATMIIGLLQVRAQLGRSDADAAARSLDDIEALARRLLPPRHVVNAILGSESYARTRPSRHWRGWPQKLD